MELCHYPCPIKTRTYEIEAIEIPIVYNKYGDHDPDGLLYVLKKDANRIREGALRNFNKKFPSPMQKYNHWSSVPTWAKKSSFISPTH